MGSIISSENYRPEYFVTGHIYIPNDDIKYDWKMIEYNQSNKDSRSYLGYYLSDGWEISGRYINRRGIDPNYSRIILKKIKNY